MRRMPVVALAVALVVSVLAVVAPVAPAGAAAAVLTTSSSAGGAGSGATPSQEPEGPIEAPADDGTGGSADDERDDVDQDENPSPAVPEQDIIPRPNSGHEPSEAGDRGGALQILVFVAIVAGVGAVLLLARRDIRRSRARRGSPDEEPSPAGSRRSDAVR